MMGKYEAIDKLAELLIDRIERADDRPYLSNKQRYAIEDFIEEMAEAGNLYEDQVREMAGTMTEKLEVGT